MKNIDGGLAFRSSLDIDDFNVSTEAMERRIKRCSTSVVEDSARMEDSIQRFAVNGAKYIVAYLVSNGFMSLTQSIISVRGQFQQLEISFKTMLGSGIKAQELMNQLIQTAAHTPFDLIGIASGAKSLLAYGESANKVNDTLVKLGNIASGLSIPLNDIVYLYGTTMTQGRLYAQDVKQFMGRGIPLVRELAEMYGKTSEEINAMVSAGKIGFADVEKVVNKLTSSSGQFYNLMAEQSKSLTGMISNLGDSWDMALNKIGERNQDLIASVISGASYMVEHLDDILRVVKAITVAYGSYKAAIIVNTLVTKGYTGIALIDNTVRKAKIALLKVEERATGKLSQQKAKMTAVQEAHIASLQKELTIEEQSNLVKQLRVVTINNLLTAQQQEYLSNIGITTSSKNYEVAALEVLSVEQKMALNKTDLSAKSVLYQAALENEVFVKKQNAAASLENMRVEVKASAARLEGAKSSAIASLRSVELARYEVHWAKKSGDATRLVTAEKKLEEAVENQSMSRKTALAAQTDFLSKKKLLEATATKKSTVATITDTTAKKIGTTATSLFTAATVSATAALKALWLSMKTNPLGWIISLVGMAYSAFTLFSSKTDETTKKLTGMVKVIKTTTDKFSEQAGKVDALQKILESSNNAYKQRNKALLDLKKIIPDYNAGLNKEGELINNNTDAISNYLTQLEKQIKLKAAQEELEASYKAKRTLSKEEKTQSKKYWNVRQTNTLQGYDRSSLTAKISRLFGSEDESNAKKKLDDTRKKIAEIDAAILSLNKEINTTSTELDKLNKTKIEIDSENAINKRIKELKDERAAVKINSDKYKELTKLIQEQQDKLPKNLTTEKSIKRVEQLADRRRKAQIKLEKANVKAMKDGYEKRKAILNLQHKETLYAIDKEQKDLEEAKRKAGKGSLSNDEKDIFLLRKKNENKLYQRQQKDLLLGEIAEKKKQYELYYKWLNNMGTEFAEEKFKKLLVNGVSYREYITKEINKIEKDSSKDKSSRDRLFILKQQMSFLDGKKDPLEKFKESLSFSLTKASTLAEKMAVIVKAKEELESGKSGLIGDQQKEGSLVLENQEEQTNKEIHKRLLSDFKSYEEKRKQIQDEYALLRNADEAKNNEDLLKRIKEGENKALSELNAGMLMQSQSWTDLFTNLESLSADKISDLITKIENQLSTGKLKLSPVDYKALIESLDKAKDMLVNKNPFKALGKYYDNYIKAKKELAKAKKAGDKDAIAKWDNEVKKSLIGLTQTITKVTAFASSCATSLQGMFSSLGKDDLSESLGTAIEMIGSLGTAAQGVGQIMSGDILGGVSSIVSSVSSVVSMFAKLHDKKYEKRIKLLEEQANGLERAYNRLSRAFNKTYWEMSGKQEEAHNRNLSAIQMQISALERQKEVAQRSWNFLEYAQLTAQISKLQKSLASAKESGDMFDIIDAQKKNLKQQQELLQKQIQAERAKKDVDKDRINEWNNKIIEITQQIEDLDRTMIETLAGTDVKSAIDEFGDAIVEAISSGGDAMEALGSKINDILKKAVVDSIKRQFLAKSVNEAVNYLGEAMKDGKLSEKEREKFTKLIKEAGKTTEEALKALGDWAFDKDKISSDSLKGAIRSMSEETGGVVAGRLEAMIIYQAQANKALVASLNYQAEIAANTKISADTLRNIEKTVSSLSNSNDSLLSQGIS